MSKTDSEDLATVSFKSRSLGCFGLNKNDCRGEDCSIMNTACTVQVSEGQWNNMNI